MAMNIDMKELLDMMKPEGLKLSEEEKKLMFFKDVAAQYAAKAKYGRTPSANNIARAANTFGTIGAGGADPLLMMMLTKMMNEKDEKVDDDKPVLEDILGKLVNVVGKMDKKLDGIGK